MERALGLLTPEPRCNVFGTRACGCRMVLREFRYPASDVSLRASIMRVSYPLHAFAGLFTSSAWEVAQPFRTYVVVPSLICLLLVESTVFYTHCSLVLLIFCSLYSAGVRGQSSTTSNSYPTPRTIGRSRGRASWTRSWKTPRPSLSGNIR